MRNFRDYLQSQIQISVNVSSMLNFYFNFIKIDFIHIMLQSKILVIWKKCDWQSTHAKGHHILISNDSPTLESGLTKISSCGCFDWRGAFAVSWEFREFQGSDWGHVLSVWPDALVSVIPAKGRSQQEWSKRVKGRTAEQIKDKDKFCPSKIWDDRNQAAVID